MVCCIYYTIIMRFVEACSFHVLGQVKALFSGLNHLKWRDVT